jgi:SAM-dependent methyltransferase
VSICEPGSADPLIAEIALAAAPDPGRVLDVGCGTGVLLRLLAERLADAELLAGIDPAPGMIHTAAAACEPDPRNPVGIGVAEDLPVTSGAFDVIVTVTSFDHRADQQRGLAEDARILWFPRFSGHFRGWFDLASQEGCVSCQHRRSTPMSCGNGPCGCTASRTRSRAFGIWASS